MNQVVFNDKFFNIGNNVKRNVLVNTDQGLMIVNRFDYDHNQVGHGQWLLDHGNCNTVEVNDCYQAIGHIFDPVIFDVGSNIGTISVWLAKIFPKGQIYCFEAQPQVYYQLCGNISINNLFNVDAFNLAVSSETGFLEFKEPNYFKNNDFGTFSLIEEKIDTSSKTKVVQSTTLDMFVSNYQIKKVDLIKIDVEGMDLNVLKGSVNILNEFLPVIYIEHFDNRKSMLDDIKDFLKDFNYNFEVRKNNLLCQK